MPGQSVRALVEKRNPYRGAPCARWRAFAFKTTMPPFFVVVDFAGAPEYVFRMQARAAGHAHKDSWSEGVLDRVSQNSSIKVLPTIFIRITT